MKLIIGIILGIIMVLTVKTAYAENRFVIHRVLLADSPGSMLRKTEMIVLDDNTKGVTCYLLDQGTQPFLQCLKVK